MILLSKGVAASAKPGAGSVSCLLIESHVCQRAEVALGENFFLDEWVDNCNCMVIIISSVDELVLICTSQVACTIILSLGLVNLKEQTEVWFLYISCNTMQERLDYHLY